MNDRLWVRVCKCGHLLVEPESLKRPWNIRIMDHVPCGFCEEDGFGFLSDEVRREFSTQTSS